MATFYSEYKFRGQRVIVRSAEPEDAKACVELIHQMDGESVFLSREPGEFELSQEQEKEYLASQKKAENSRTLLAEKDGSIIAISGAWFGKRQRFRHAGEIGIAVAKACWGIGVGRALMEEQIKWFQENGVTKVNLMVDTENKRAISLYLSLGFVVEGRCARERRLKDGAYREAYWMGLFLPDAAFLGGKNI